MTYEFKMILLIGSLFLCVPGVFSRGVVSDVYSVDNYKVVISGSLLEGDYDAYSILDPLDVKGGAIVSIEVPSLPSAGVSGSSGGGGGGGGLFIEEEIIPVEKISCSIDRDCSVGDKCVDGICFTSFKVDIVNLSKDIDSGNFLDFNYSITGQADLSGTIITDFWMESSVGNRIASGKIVMYLVDGQSVILSNRVFIPDYVESGDYFLKTSSYYIDEDVQSSDAEEVRVFGKVEPEKVNFLPWIIGFSFLVTLIILLIIKHKKLIAIWKYFVSYYLSKIKYRRKK